MAVKKKIDKSIGVFIDGGADVKTRKEKDFKNVLIRIPISILSELDGLLDKKPWLHRTQWIVDAIHDRLKSEIEDSVREKNVR